MAQYDVFSDAKLIAKICKLLYNMNDNQLYRYDKNKGIYSVISEMRMKRVISNIFSQWYEEEIWSLKYVEDVYKVLPLAAKYVNKFKDNADLIVFKNGVLNITNKSFDKFSPQYHATTCINHNYYDYDNNVSTPVFDKFIQDISCGDEAMKTCLLELIGYCMCNHIKGGRAVISFGAGANGKTTFLEFVSHILGGHTALSMKDINKSRFSLHSMVGSKLNIVNELENGVTLSDIVNANLKSIITGERIRVEPKGKDLYSHLFSTKIFMATNELPSVKKIPDYSIKRRLLLLPFNATFAGDNRDPNILEKLKQETEGVISKAMNAYYSLQDSEFKFSYQQQSDHLYDMEVKKVFPIVVWVKEHIVLATGNRVSNATLRQAFEAWLLHNGLPKSMYTDKGFSTQLHQALTFNNINQFKLVKSSGDRGIENIKLI